MSLNVGQVIEHTVRRDHMGISELSRKLHVSRRTIYNWFNQKTLSFDIVCKIGNAIRHDFSKEFPEDFAQVDPEIGYKQHAFMDADNAYANSVSYWMNKYIKLLEKYNELLSHEFSSSVSNDEVKTLTTISRNNNI